jgi:hypothetical protein
VSGPCQQLLVVRDERATATRGDGLVAVEREHRDSAAPVRPIGRPGSARRAPPRRPRPPAPRTARRARRAGSTSAGCPRVWTGSSAPTRRPVGRWTGPSARRRHARRRRRPAPGRSSASPGRRRTATGRRRSRRTALADAMKVSAGRTTRSSGSHADDAEREVQPGRAGRDGDRPGLPAAAATSSSRRPTNGPTVDTNVEVMHSWRYAASLPARFGTASGITRVAPARWPGRRADGRARGRGRRRRPRSARRASRPRRRPVRAGRPRVARPRPAPRRRPR